MPQRHMHVSENATMLLLGDERAVWKARCMCGVIAHCSGTLVQHRACQLGKVGAD